MKILYFLLGVTVYIVCEKFTVPGIKIKIQEKMYDYGIFTMQPLKGSKAVFMNKLAIYFLRIGIVVYILLGVYIFWW